MVVVVFPDGLIVVFRLFHGIGVAKHRTIEEQRSRLRIQFVSVMIAQNPIMIVMLPASSKVKSR